MSFLIPNFSKEVKQMENLKEVKNVLDLSLIDHEFIVAMLNLILEEKERTENRNNG